MRVWQVGDSYCFYLKILGADDSGFPSRENHAFGPLSVLWPGAGAGLEERQAVYREAELMCQVQR